MLTEALSGGPETVDWTCSVHTASRSVAGGGVAGRAWRRRRRLGRRGSARGPIPVSSTGQALTFPHMGEGTYGTLFDRLRANGVCFPPALSSGSR